MPASVEKKISALDLRQLTVVRRLERRYVVKHASLRPEIVAILVMRIN